MARSFKYIKIAKMVLLIAVRLFSQLLNLSTPQPLHPRKFGCITWFADKNVVYDDHKK
jgi:hypothetical protein